MNILLPDYDCVIEEGIAEIKNRKLYLYKNGVFKEVMYKISNQLKRRLKDLIQLFGIF